MEPKIIGKGSDDPRADLARENALLQQQITTLSAHITDLYRREGQLQERLNRAGMFCGQEGMTALMGKTEKQTCAGVNSLPSPAISAAAPDDSDEDKMFRFVRQKAEWLGSVIGACSFAPRLQSRIKSGHSGETPVLP